VLYSREYIPYRNVNGSADEITGLPCLLITELVSHATVTTAVSDILLTCTAIKWRDLQS
jgi:hypothetical protein